MLVKGFAVFSLVVAVGQIRLVMALLIAVAVVALLGTLVYWVRAGDASGGGREDLPDSPEPEDTLG